MPRGWRATRASPDEGEACLAPTFGRVKCFAWTLGESLDDKFHRLFRTSLRGIYFEVIDGSPVHSLILPDRRAGKPARSCQLPSLKNFRAASETYEQDVKVLECGHIVLEEFGLEAEIVNDEIVPFARESCCRPAHSAQHAQA